MDKISKLQEIIDSSNNIVFFGGAGVSTASGIKDFRGKNGLYKEKFDYPPEYLLSIDCFTNKPDIFYDFYKSKMNSLDIKPNRIHLYLTELEERGKLKAIVTQNIDGLHQKAGSKNILEIHGTTYKNHCVDCNKEFDAEYVFNSKGIPKCSCGGIIKPDVVLYGEMLPECFSLAIKYISCADTLIVAGTSLTVEPASSLIRYFRGNNLIIINNDKTLYDNLATLVINDDLEEVFKKLK
jgi:NAD-dependent deacetylase